MQRNKNNKKNSQKKKAIPRGLTLPKSQRRQTLTGRSTGSKDPGSMIVHHREVIALVEGAIVTPTRVFTFQPGTMSWLSAFASRFEHYELLGGSIRWTSSNATTVSGSLAISIDYDVLDDVPPTFVDMLNGSNVVNGAVWDDLSLPIRKQHIVPSRKFCRVGFSAPALSDSRMYDSFAVTFCATGGPVGFLTVDYTVRFSTPQIVTAGSDAAESDSISTVSTYRYPVVNMTKTATGAGVRMREATEAEAATYSMPSGSALLETIPNWQGFIDLLTKNTAGNESSNIQLESLAGAYPDAEFGPDVTALEDLLVGSDGRAKRSFRVKTKSVPGLLRFRAVNAAESPISMMARSATGSYGNLEL